MAQLDVDKTAGIVLYTEAAGDDAAAPGAWSAGNLVPNAKYGYVPPGEDGAVYNPAGGGYGEGSATGLHWLNLGNRPLFLLQGAAATSVKERITDGSAWPLLGMTLDFFMQAAASSDAEQCLRRGYCQALGGNSVVGWLRPYASGDGVVMVAAQLDAVSLFHELSFGAEASGLALAVQVAAAGAIARGYSDAERTSKFPRNIAFAQFQGEQFGYIGSAATNDGINGGTFPGRDGAWLTPAVMNDAKYIELGPLKADGQYTKWGTADLLQEVAAVTEEPGVPPSSLRGLRGAEEADGHLNVPDAVVLTAESTLEAAYTRYDNGATAQSNTTAALDALEQLALGVAQAAVRLASGGAEDGAGLAVDRPMLEAMVTQLTVDQAAPSGNWSLSQQVSNVQAGTPLNRYVNVETATSLGEYWGYYQLAQALQARDGNPGDGWKEVTIGKEKVWAVVGLHAASSSPKTGMWTESYWQDDYAAQVYLMADPTQDAATLAGGIVYAVVAVAAAYRLR